MLRGHGPRGFTFTLPPLFTLPHLFTSSISVLYLALSNSHSLTSLFGILVHSSTILKPILQIQKLCQKFRPNLKPRSDKLTTPTWSSDYPKHRTRPEYSIEYRFKI